MEKIKELLKRIPSAIAAIGIPLIIWTVMVLFSVLTSYPSVKVQFENFSGPHGYGAPFWVATVEVIDGRPSGISNLNVKFTFPNEISNIETVSEGGCDGLDYYLEKVNKPKYSEYNRFLAYTGSIKAKNCPSDSKASFRFTLKPSQCDEIPVPDEGRYEGQFDWKIPLTPFDVPWSKYVFWSKLSGTIPASKQEQPYVNSSVIQKPPYYDLKKREGDVHIYYEPDFFNRKIMTDTTIFSFCRPSTKFKLYSKKEKIVGAWIYWIYCERPLFLETKVKPVDVDKLKKEGLGVAVWVLWKEREANLKIVPTKKIKEKDGSVTLEPYPTIFTQTFFNAGK